MHYILTMLSESELGVKIEIKIVKWKNCEVVPGWHEKLVVDIEMSDLKGRKKTSSF